LVKTNGDGLGTGRVEEVIRYIESKYVDKIDGEELVEEAVQSLLHKLDPHSLYLTPEMVKRTNEEMAGSFIG
jgi:carboxyl-terminal processing protease